MPFDDLPNLMPQSRDCSMWADDIVWAHLGSLPDTRHQQLKAHLAVCTGCKEVFDGYALIEAWVGELLVCISDEALRELLGTIPADLPAEIPAPPPVVEMSEEFVQLWLTWQDSQESRAARTLAADGICNVLDLSQSEQPGEQAVPGMLGEAALFSEQPSLPPCGEAGIEAAYAGSGSTTVALASARAAAAAIVVEETVRTQNQRQPRLGQLRQSLYYHRQRYLPHVSIGWVIAVGATVLQCVRRTWRVLVLPACRAPRPRLLQASFRRVQQDARWACSSLVRFGCLTVAGGIAVVAAVLNRLLVSLSESTNLLLGLVLAVVIVPAVALMVKLTRLLSLFQDEIPELLETRQYALERAPLAPLTRRSWNNRQAIRPTSSTRVRAVRAFVGRFLNRVWCATLHRTAGLHSTLSNVQGLLRAGELRTAHERLVYLTRRRNSPPELRAQALHHLAVAWRRQGELGMSSQVLDELERLLDLSSTLPLAELHDSRALLLMDRGTIAARRGEYIVAASNYRRAEAEYWTLLSAVPSAADRAYLGLGRVASYLARIALFQGEPSEALNHCSLAEAQFGKVNDAALAVRHERDEALQRTRELAAWAYARHGQFRRAIQLHLEARTFAEAAGDAVNTMKNWAHLGDDYRHMVEARINAQRQLPRWHFANQRVVLEALCSADTGQATEKPVMSLIDFAEEAYTQALMYCQQQKDALLLALYLRNMAIVQRWKGAHARAKHLLDRAQEHAEKLQQSWLLPSIAESYAALYWDQGSLKQAESYYNQVLELLRDAGPDNMARAHMRQRTRFALEALERAIAPKGIDEALDKIIDAQGWSEWRQTAQQLALLVRDAVVQTQAKPVAYSRESTAWFCELKTFEGLPGGRVLAQDELSISLAHDLSECYRGDKSAWQQRRHKALLEHIQQAARLAETDQPSGLEIADRVFANRDLCCRQSIETKLTQRNVRKCLLSALELMRLYPGGYSLEAGAFHLPLGFAVKGSCAVVEVPAPVAQALQLWDKEEDSDTGTVLEDQDVASCLCYVFRDDKRLAIELQMIFESLTRLARRSVATRMPAREWMQRLVYDKGQCAAASPPGLGL